MPEAVVEAKIRPHPDHSTAVCLRVCRVDVALAAALEAARAATPAPTRLVG